MKKYFKYLNQSPTRMGTLILPNVICLGILLANLLNPYLLGTDGGDQIFRIIFIVVMVLVPVLNTIHSVKCYNIYKRKRY